MPEQQPVHRTVHRPVHRPVHRVVEVPGGRIHCVEQGSGPLVLLVHGFPESWYSWRHQLPALADAGYRAVAIDVRGYGRGGGPPPGGARPPPPPRGGGAPARAPPQPPPRHGAQARRAASAP
ncbi:alpha/beta fold hydrolase, partial [Streptomyces xiamenensis]